jgi:predicted benzoate:H+ symporter BenE
MLIAAISAALVELLHASASGGFRFNPPLVTIGVTVLCGLVAAGVTRLRLLFPRPAPQEAVK